MTIVSVGRKPYEEWLSESRVRENLKHGLMRGWWKHSVFFGDRISVTVLLYSFRRSPTRIVIASPSDSEGEASMKKAVNKIFSSLINRTNISGVHPL